MKLAMQIFCRKIILNHTEVTGKEGPLLLACNHPNSFLDAVIIAALFDRPVYSLARGDVFKNKLMNYMLRTLKMLPVYRVSEGIENLNSNYDTFNACKDIFRNNGIVLIFSEGRCVNEWHLRPLKKGTARLAIDSWQNEMPLTVLPVGINYSSFRKFGKNVFLNFGNAIHSHQFDLHQPDGILYQQFNIKLRNELEHLVYEIADDDVKEKRRLLEVPIAPWKRAFLLLPAILGWITHVPLYLPARLFTKNMTAHSDHYDSIIVTLLLFAYPFYLIAIAILLVVLTGSFWFIVTPIVLPLLAWSFVQLKRQT